MGLEARAFRVASATYLAELRLQPQGEYLIHKSEGDDTLSMAQVCSPICGW